MDLRRTGIKLRPAAYELVKDLEARFGEIKLKKLVENAHFQKQKLAEDAVGGRLEWEDKSPVIYLGKDAGEHILVHELLHVDLVHQGIAAPQLDIRQEFEDDEGPSEQRMFFRDAKAVHGQLANLLDHRLMYPKFLDLGFPSDQFSEFPAGLTKGFEDALPGLRAARKGAWLMKVMLNHIGQHQEWAPDAADRDCWLSLGSGADPTFQKKADALLHTISSVSPEQLAREYVGLFVRAASELGLRCTIAADPYPELPI